MFRISQQAHGFVRGTPLVRQGGIWVQTDGTWTAVVANILDANTFEATDSGVIDYPPGTFIPDYVLTTGSGTLIGTAITNSKLLLNASGSSSTAATSSTSTGLSGSGLDQYYAKWVGSSVSYGQIHEDASSLYLGPTTTITPTLLSTTGAATVTGDITTAGSVHFNPTMTTPSFSEGTVYWDSTDRCLAFNTDQTGVSVQIGQEMLVRVRNATGSTLLNGQVVIVSGAQGNRPKVVLAQGDTEAHSDSVIGVMTADLANNTDGYVLTIGLLHNFDTSAWAEGTVLYLSTTTAGGLTSTKPIAPQHSVRIGVVTRQHPTQGIIYVHPDTYPELSELHDTVITSPVNHDTLQYDGTVWRNVASPVFAGADPTSVSTNQVAVGGGYIYAANNIQLGASSYLNWGSGGIGGYIKGNNAGSLQVSPVTNLVLYGSDSGIAPDGSTVAVGGGFIRSAESLIAYGADPGSVSSGQSIVSGGYIRVSNNIYADTMYAASSYLLGNNWSFILSSGALVLTHSFSIYNLMVWANSGTNGYVNILGADNGSVSANQVSMGGGVLRTATQIVANTVSDTYAIVAQGYSTTDHSYGVNVRAGTSNLDTAFRVGNSVNSATAYTVRGDMVNIFSGTDPGSVSTGQVTLGGGVVRAGGSFYCYNGQSVLIGPSGAATVESSQGLRVGNTGASGKYFFCGYDDVNDYGYLGAINSGVAYKALIALPASGGYFGVVGADPGSVSAGQVTIGGGVLRTGGSAVIGTSSTNNSISLYGPASGTGAGCAIAMVSSTASYLGNVSAILGGAFDNTALWYSPVATKIYSGGALAVTINTSQGSTFYGTDPGSVPAGQVTIGGGVVRAYSDIFTGGGTYLIRTSSALTNGSGASIATLTNAPVAGNPTKWISIDDNGTTRKIPCW